ncbi:MAG: PfkB family carbohydrate kinase [Alphaproteobacteria bacterium]|jgi:sulfofructose kinase
MAEIICVGNAVFEQVYEVADLTEGDEILLAHGYRQTGAGTAANTAIAVRRLGGAAIMWARLGDDETGDLIAGDLARYDVDCSMVQRSRGSQSSLESTVLAANGKRQVTRFEGAGLPDDAAWLPLGRIQDCNAVLADTTWPTGARTVFEAAHDQNWPRVLVVDAASSDVPADLAAAASHILFTQAALARFSGSREPDTALAAAAARAGTFVAVTDGTDGLRWCTPEEEQPGATPPVALDLADPSGSRDALAGAFALALGEEKPLAEAIAFAVTAAGITGTARGARQAMPDRRTVWDLMTTAFPEFAGADA